jgi:hypothetical protein
MHVQEQAQRHEQVPIMPRDCHRRVSASDQTRSGAATVKVDMHASRHGNMNAYTAGVLWRCPALQLPNENLI